MPPNLEIYGLTKYRDAVTIDRFLNAYVDRAKSWDRGDEELMMEPLPHTHPGQEMISPGGNPIPLSGNRH